MIKYVKDPAVFSDVSEALVSTYSEGVRSKALLTALGDYWTDYYADSDTLAAAATGAVALYSSEYSKLLDMVLASNIIDIPDKRPVYYQLYSLSQNLFKEHTQPNGTVDYIYTDFPNVNSIQYFTSSLFEPGVILESGKHFIIEEGKLKFFVDVFTDNSVTNYSYTENDPPDMRIYLWATNVVFSDTLIYKRFGKFVYKRGEDSKEYHNISLAMLKFYADSKSVTRVEAIINIMFGLPFSRYSGEVVTAITPVTSSLLPATGETDAGYYEIATTHTKYYAFIGAKLLVSVGDILSDYELIARCHLVKDYITDPEWHKKASFPKELLVHDSGAVPLSEIMDKVLRFNIVYIKFIATFDTYDQYRRSVTELIGLIKSGLPVYLYPCFDKAFAADFSDVVDFSEGMTFGSTTIVNGTPVLSSGASMEHDEYYSRCRCGEFSGECDYWGEPIIDHGYDSIMFLPHERRQYRGDDVFFDGIAYLGGTNDHSGKAPKDIIYTMRPQEPPRFDGSVEFNHYGAKAHWHKPMPLLKHYFNGQNEFQQPVNSPEGTQLFGRHHTCETDYVTGQTIRIAFSEDTFDSEYGEDLLVTEIRNGQYSDCYITGPVELAAGQTAHYTSTRGIADNILFSGTMELVSQDDTGFICRLPEGVNQAEISIYYDAILCTTLTVHRASVYFAKPVGQAPKDLQPITPGMESVVLLASEISAHTASGDLAVEPVEKTAWEVVGSDGVTPVFALELDGPAAECPVPVASLVSEELYSWRTKVYSEFAGWSEFSEYTQFLPRPVLGAQTRALELLNERGRIVRTKSAVAPGAVYAAVSKLDSKYSDPTTNLLALDANGESLWEVKLANAAGDSFLALFTLAIPAGVCVGCLVAGEHIELRAYDSTGAALWTQALYGDSAATAGAASGADALYVYSEGAVYKLSALTGTIESSVTLPLLPSTVGAPAVDTNGQLYLFGYEDLDPDPLCVAFDDALNVLWSKSLNVASGYVWGLAAAYTGVVVYGLCEAGVFCTQLSASDGSVQASFSLPAEGFDSNTKAVVVAGKVLLSCGGAAAMLPLSGEAGRVLSLSPMPEVTKAQIERTELAISDGYSVWLGLGLSAPDRKVAHLVLGPDTISSLDGRDLGVGLVGFGTQTFVRGTEPFDVIVTNGEITASDYTPEAIVAATPTEGAQGSVVSQPAELYMGGRDSDIPYNSVLDWTFEKRSFDRSENNTVTVYGPAFPPVVSFGMLNAPGLKWGFDMSSGYARQSIAGKNFTVMYTTSLPSPHLVTLDVDYQLMGSILSVTRDSFGTKIKFTNGEDIAVYPHSWQPGEEVCIVAQCFNGQMRVGVATAP